MVNIFYSFTDKPYGFTPPSEMYRYEMEHTPSGHRYNSFWAVLGSCGARILAHGANTSQKIYQKEGIAVGIDISLNEEITPLKVPPNPEFAEAHIEKVSLKLGEDILNLALLVSNDSTTPLYAG